MNSRRSHQNWIESRYHWNKLNTLRRRSFLSPMLFLRLHSNSCHHCHKPMVRIGVYFFEMFLKYYYLSLQKLLPTQTLGSLNDLHIIGVECIIVSIILVVHFSRHFSYTFIIRKTKISMTPLTRTIRKSQ